MTSLPVYFQNENVEGENLHCKCININGAKRINKRETMKLFPKFKKHICGDKFYIISPKSIEISCNSNYTVQITDDGCFDIIFSKFGYFYRVFTRGSFAIIQSASALKYQLNSFKNVGSFIPSPLAIFVSFSSEKIEIEDEIENEEEFQDTIDSYDEEFEFMFSNEVEPIVGGFKDVSPWLLA